MGPRPQVLEDSAEVNGWVRRRREGSRRLPGGAGTLPGPSPYSQETGADGLLWGRCCAKYCGKAKQVADMCCPQEAGGLDWKVRLTLRQQ